MFNRHFHLVIHTATSFVGTTPIVGVCCEIPYYLARVAEGSLGCVAESSHIAFACETEQIWRIKSWIGPRIQSACTLHRAGLLKRYLRMHHCRSKDQREPRMIGELDPLVCDAGHVGVAF